MISQNIVKQLINTPGWGALHEHINDAIIGLDTLADIPFADKEAAAIEGRARQLAVDKLKDILKPFVTYRAPSDDGQNVSEKEEDAGI